MRRFSVVPSGLSKFLVALAAVLALAVGAWAQGGALSEKDACEHVSVNGYWHAAGTNCYTGAPESGAPAASSGDCATAAASNVWVAEAGHANGGLCFSAANSATIAFSTNCVAISTHSWLSTPGICAEIVDPTNASSIALTLSGIAPVALATPAATVAVTNLGSPPEFAVTSVSWFDAATAGAIGSGTAHTGPFGYAKIYHADIVLTATANEYVFVGTYAATTYGASTSAGTIGGGGSTLTIRASFAATGLEPVTPAALHVAEPMFGNTAWGVTDLQVPAGAGFAATTVAWTATQGGTVTAGTTPFVLNEVYTVAITLTATAVSHTFTGYTHKADDFFEGSAVSANTGTTLTLTKTFAAATTAPMVTEHNIAWDPNERMSPYGLANDVAFHIQNNGSRHLTGLTQSGDPSGFRISRVERDGSVVSNENSKLFALSATMFNAPSGGTSQTAINTGPAGAWMRITPTVTTPAGDYKITIQIRGMTGLEPSMIQGVLNLKIGSVDNTEIVMEANDDPLITKYPVASSNVTVKVKNENADGVNVGAGQIRITGITRNGEEIGKNHLTAWAAHFTVGALTSSGNLNAPVPAGPSGTPPATLPNEETFTVAANANTPAGEYIIQFGIKATSGIYNEDVTADGVITSEEWVALINVESILGDDISLDDQDNPLTVTYGSVPTTGPEIIVTNKHPEYDLVGARVAIARIMRKEGEVTTAVNTATPPVAIFSATTGIAGTSVTLEADEGSEGKFRINATNTTPPGEYNIVFGIRSTSANQPLDVSEGVTVSSNLHMVFDSLTFTVNPAVVANRNIRGITVPAAGGSNVRDTIFSENQYRGTITWDPELINDRFAPNVAYTAIVSLTPARGFTFEGIDGAVPFTANTEATNVEYAGSGVVNVTFAATSGAAVVTERNIQNIVRPVRTENPVWRVMNSEQFVVPDSVVWEPAVVENTFEANTVYTVSMALVAREGFTLTGVPANGFTVTGASSTNFDASTGVLTATFPETGDAIIIGSGINTSIQNDNRSIKGFDRSGVKLANFGVRPDAGGLAPSAVHGNHFTGTITWTPEPLEGRFQPGEQYTANITLKANVGYTFEGMAANTFRVSTTPNSSPTVLPTVHEAGSNEVQVTFNPIVAPATINNFVITGMVAPRVGGIPVVRVGNSSNLFDGVVEWTPGLMNGRFVANTVYTAKITMEAAPGRTFTGVAAAANFTLNNVTSATEANNTPGTMRTGSRVYTAGSNVIEFTFNTSGPYAVSVVSATGSNPLATVLRGGLTERIESEVVYQVTTVGVPSGFYTATIAPVSTNAAFSTNIEPAAQVEIDATGRGELRLRSTGDFALTSTANVQTHLRIVGADVDATTANSFGVAINAFVPVTNITVASTKGYNRPVNLTREAVFTPAGPTKGRTDIEWEIVPLEDAPDLTTLGVNSGWCAGTGATACTQPEVTAAIAAHEAFEKANPRIVVDGDSTYLYFDYVITSTALGGGVTAHRGINVIPTIANGGAIVPVSNPEGNYVGAAPLPITIVAEALGGTTDMLMSNTAISDRVIQLPNLSQIFPGEDATVTWDVENIHILDNGVGTVTAATVDNNANTLTFSVNELYQDSETLVFTIPVVSSDEDEMRIMPGSSPGVYNDAYTVTVTFLRAPAEAAPAVVVGTNVSFDYAAERLAGIAGAPGILPERSYRVRVMRTISGVVSEDANIARVTVESDEDGSIDISQWIRQSGTTPAPVAAMIQLSLVAEPDPQNHVVLGNSPWTNSITVPLRGVAPTGVVMGEVNNDFASLQVTNVMEYRNRLDVDTSWIGVRSDMLTGTPGRITVPVGIFQVRNSATASAFASKDTVFTFGDVALVEPTPSVTAASIDYAGERLLGLVTGRSYIVASGSNESTVTAAGGAISITDFIGSTVTIVLVARDGDWENSVPSAAIAIPARPAAPVVTATPVTAEGPGRIEGVEVGMAYKLATAAVWSNVTTAQQNAGFVSITAANAGDYQVRYNAIASGAGAAFASVPATVTVENQTSIQDIAREDPVGGKTEDVAAFVPVRTASKFAAGPSPVVVGGVVNFFGHSGVGSLRIFDAAGKVVREVSVTEGWDLKDARGRYVAEGTYVVRGVLTVNGERVRVSVPVTVVK